MARDKETLLLEIGCEEIPSRMIPAATAELGRRVIEVLDRAGLGHGPSEVWGGARRLAVRVEDVAARQADRDERVLGPPAAVAFDKTDGKPTKAALGFARKQGVEADRLARFETERGVYVGFERRVEGRELAAVLVDTLPAVVAKMPFPKSMRWGDGSVRWVRPVHWMTTLFGELPIPVELFGVVASGCSRGHRFLGPESVEIGQPQHYEEALEKAYVLVDPGKRRERIAAELQRMARSHDGIPIEDEALLEEVSDLVEWPGVVAGRFDEAFLELPREILVTTLRHHQKCFSVQDGQGKLLGVFLAVGNTDRDPSGHIRRGNEWVVGGRLEDARFFWREDRKTRLEELSSRLDGVVFHRDLGSYSDKAERVAALAKRLAALQDSTQKQLSQCETAGRLCKNDLVTGTVGEFPELQGKVGGLLLAADGAPAALWSGVYEHYQPVGPDDSIPPGPIGRVVSVADKLDSVVRLIGAGERASGSRDPLGLRRAANGIVRVMIEGAWELSLSELMQAADAEEPAIAFLRERMEGVLRERGFTIKEILAVTRPRVDPQEALAWSLTDIVARLDAIKQVRGRQDFTKLVKLTERVDNILTKNEQKIREIVSQEPAPEMSNEIPEAEQRLAAMVEQSAPEIASASDRKCYDEVVESLSRFIDPVESFFMDCLVIDPDDPVTTGRRHVLLRELDRLFTKYFDIRELAGEADGGTP